MTLRILPLLEEASHESAGATPFLIGGAALLILFGLVFALVAFGNGREHS